METTSHSGTTAGRVALQTVKDESRSEERLSQITFVDHGSMASHWPPENFP